MSKLQDPQPGRRGRWLLRFELLLLLALVMPLVSMLSAVSFFALMFLIGLWSLYLSFRYLTAGGNMDDFPPPFIITGAPGGRLRRIAELCFSKKAYGLVFEPILSDLLIEYFEALAEPDLVKARFVLARGYGAFWMAFVAQLPVSLLRVVFELWKATKTG